MQTLLSNLPHVNLDYNRTASKDGLLFRGLSHTLDHSHSRDLTLCWVPEYENQLIISKPCSPPIVEESPDPPLLSKANRQVTGMLVTWNHLGFSFVAFWVDLPS